MPGYHTKIMIIELMQTAVITGEVIIRPVRGALKGLHCSLVV